MFVGLSPILAMVVFIYMGSLSESSMISDVHMYWYLSVKVGLAPGNSCA